MGEEIPGKMSTRLKTKRRIDKKWDAIIWMGDFNSRVEDFSLPHPKTNQPQKCMPSTFDAMNQSRYEDLFKADQFTVDSKKMKLIASHGFQEGNPETWAPTFKLKNKDGETFYGTKRVPSWTDRIFFRSSKIGDREGA